MSCVALTRSCEGGDFLRGGARPPAAQVAVFIDQNQDDVVDGRRLGVEPICEVLQMAPSTYYAARDRPHSRRAPRDAELTPRLTGIWKDNYQVYGSRKLWKTARRAGIDIGRDQTARLMRQAQIQGVLRSKRVRRTRRDASAGRHPDFLRATAFHSIAVTTRRPAPGSPLPMHRLRSQARRWAAFDHRNP